MISVITFEEMSDRRIRNEFDPKIHQKEKAQTPPVDVRRPDCRGRSSGSVVACVQCQSAEEERKRTARSGCKHTGSKLKCCVKI